jgi:hypothetical protein
MTKEEAIQVFEQRNIRSFWDTEAEAWYFSIVDVVGVLTESPNPRKYWSVLKTRLKKEGSELATNCSQLKMTAADGKKYQTDCATTEQLFRLVQSIPSPKAEPFKQWMAQVASERIDQIHCFVFTGPLEACGTAAPAGSGVRLRKRMSPGFASAVAAVLRTA